MIPNDMESLSQYIQELTKKGFRISIEPLVGGTGLKQIRVKKNGVTFVQALPEGFPDPSGKDTLAFKFMIKDLAARVEDGGSKCPE